MLGSSNPESKDEERPILASDSEQESEQESEAPSASSVAYCNLTYFLKQLEKLIALMDQLIRQVIGTGGGLCGVLLALPALGISIAGIALIIIPVVALGIALIQYLVNTYYPESKDKVWKKSLLSLFSAIGTAGAVGFTFSLLGIATAVANPLTLGILAIILIAKLYEAYAQEKLDPSGLIEYATAITGAGGAISWFLYHSLLTIGIKAIGLGVMTAVSSVAFPVTIAIIACSVAYLLYKAVSYSHQKQKNKAEAGSGSLVDPGNQGLFAQKSENPATEVEKGQPQTSLTLTVS